MKKFIYLMLFVGVSIFSEAQNLTLEVEITGLESSNGKILLQLYHSNEKGENVVHSEYFGRIYNNICVMELNNLSPGDYGIQYFHDEDLNGELNTNFIGIPKEGFGYSNNPKISFGAPDYSEWKFYLEENKVMQLKTNNF